MFRKILSAVLIIPFLFAAADTASLSKKLGLPVEPGSYTAHAQEDTPPCSPPLRPNGSDGGRGDGLAYIEAIERTADMVWDDEARHLASLHGLQVLNLTWEDTGRYYNSSVGPNISDVTIQVQHMEPYSCEYMLTLMPVIRYPNFSDLTADIPLDRFYLLVGNEDGGELQRITLREYLGNFRNYLSEPRSWRGWGKSLLAKRDTHVLVSAQAAFLPVPQEGKAEFNPVIFNYQSYEDNPAVLAIVATREGTSATVIDNVRDAFPAGYSWGQRLFFNQDGERASFTGERLSDIELQEEPSGATRGDEKGKGLNMVMIIQVPLKHKSPIGKGFGISEDAAMMPAAPMAEGSSDVEAAVIGHGVIEGPFTEIDRLKIKRDERFPIRVTVQFYKATSNGIVSEEDMQEIAGEIERVYSEADYVGSLVVGGGSDRPTEYDGNKTEPEGWWGAFWYRFERNTGLDGFDARELWENLDIHTGWWGDW
ncbi:hypothetical protein ACFLUA_03845 [Chloroflexota bacterium]